MSGKTAAFILETIERGNKHKKGVEVDEAKIAEFRQSMIERYDKEGHPYVTGAHLFHDGIITWGEARDRLARGFELALHQPIPDSHFGNFKF